MKKQRVVLIITVFIFLSCYSAVVYCRVTDHGSGVSNELSIGLRARAGDKDSAKYLIERLNRHVELSIAAKARSGNDRNDWHFVDSVGRAFNLHRGLWLETGINELFLCGTNECLKAALSFFARYQPRLDTLFRASRHQYHPRGPQGIRHILYDVEIPLRGESKEYSDSPRDYIIKGFRKYHPGVPLLHAEYDSLWRRFRKQQHLNTAWEPLDYAVIVEYMERFVDWGNRTYGTNFKLESRLLFTGQYDLENPRGRELFEREQRRLRTYRRDNDMRIRDWGSQERRLEILRLLHDAMIMDRMECVLDSLDNVMR